MKMSCNHLIKKLDTKRVCGTMSTTYYDTKTLNTYIYGYAEFWTNRSHVT